MSDFLTVEPSPELAGRFAVWALSHDPHVKTVSAGGFLIRLDLYPDVPAELLVGAFVDGFPVRTVSAPLGAEQRDGSDPGPRGAERQLEAAYRLDDGVPKPVPSKRAPRKRTSSRKPGSGQQV